MAVGRRLDLKLGFACNNNCRFCAVGDKVRSWNKDTQKAKKDLREAAREGLKEVVFTGGEPTVRKDILELVSYAKELGYESIQMQSNGRMFFYRGFCENIINAGANQFAISIHGPTANIHDFLTRSPGSFEQTLQGIKNLKELNQKVLTNSVATKSNYTHLPQLARLLVSLKVDQLQMAFVHAVGNAYKNFDYIVPRKSLAAPYIQKALQIGIDAGIQVMAEDMPYCFMRGYESYLGELYAPPTQVRSIDYIDPKFEETRVKEGKCKAEKCKKCRYYLVCEGPWREYPEKRGWDEFIPVEDYVEQALPQTPIDDTEVMLEKAREYFLSGDAHNSLNYYKKILDKNPSCSAALFNTAELCDFKLFEGSERDFTEFMTLYQKALKANHNNPAAFFLMAKIYKVKKNYKKAIEYYSKACALDPANWRLWASLGLAYRNNRDVEIGNNIIFNLKLYQKLFSKNWKDVYDQRLKNLLSVINAPEDLNKVLNEEPRFKVLSFRINPRKINRNTGNKIMKFLDRLRAENIVFRLSRPLPNCLFSSSAYQRMLDDYGMPKDCSECLELVIMHDENVELCSRRRIKLDREIIKSEIYKKIEADYKRHNLRCEKCIYNVRKMCGVCYGGGD